MALVFAAIGIYQYETRDVFWNPKLLVSNAYAPFYRVNSVFWDPSIYGRFLVVAILACLVAVLFGRDRRLLIGCDRGDRGDLGRPLLLVLAVELRGARRRASCIAVDLRLGSPRGLDRGGRRRAWSPSARLPCRTCATTLFGNGRGLNSSTGGRGKLVRNGIKIAVHHPVAGVGIGGFKHAYAELADLKGSEPKAAASHNDAGHRRRRERDRRASLLYVWLLVAALLLAFRRFARDLPGLTALTCGLVFAAVAVHSLFYNAFFEDPTVWAAIGLAAALPRRQRRARATGATRPGGRTRAAAGSAGRRR